MNKFSKCLKSLDSLKGDFSKDDLINSMLLQNHFDFLRTIEFFDNLKSIRDDFRAVIYDDCDGIPPRQMIFLINLLERIEALCK